MYDVIIIGAGISGLVCGCYLAKAGMKVLIAEQHYKPGGYCTSFKRKGFLFDACVHSFGGYRKAGIVRKVFNDLGTDKRIGIKRFDPSDIIITPDYKFSFWADLDRTIKEFQNVFPDEKDNINKFFYILVNSDPNSFIHMRGWTFKDLLSKHFTNDKLKAILSFPLFGNSGLPPYLMSAFVGATILREFILDGGYYPEGSMQALSDSLTEILKECGGKLRLSSLVKKIRVRNNKVIGVVLENDEFIPSRYVISNCDARQTFLKLLGKSKISQDFLDMLNGMIPSLSAFILYLGVDKFNELPLGTYVWVMSHYNVDNAYLSAEKGNFNDIGGYRIHASPDRKSVIALTLVPFKNREYWNNNKKKLLDSFIKIIERNTIPELSKHILYREAATPHTLYRYTLNYKGAAFGWSSTPSQLAITDLRKPSFSQGLYLTGHWTTQGFGIPGVVYVGYDTARTILRKERINYN